MFMACKLIVKDLFSSSACHLLFLGCEFIDANHFRLGLISKVHGSEKFEEYCRHIPERYPVLEAYNALLNFYAKAKQLEKAEATLQIMKDLRLVKTAFPYHTMRCLYYQTGEYKNMNLLSQEMEKKRHNVQYIRF